MEHNRVAAGPQPRRCQARRVLLLNARRLDALVQSGPATGIRNVNALVTRNAAVERRAEAQQVAVRAEDVEEHRFVVEPVKRLRRAIPEAVRHGPPHPELRQSHRCRLVDRDPRRAPFHRLPPGMHFRRRPCAERGEFVAGNPRSRDN